MPLRRKGGERKPTADLICSLTSSQIDPSSFPSFKGRGGGGKGGEPTYVLT